MFEIFHNKKLIQKERERERIKGENLDPTAINNSLRNCTALKKGRNGMISGGGKKTF